MERFLGALSRESEEEMIKENPHACPLCGSDLAGDPIPIESVKKGYYGKGLDCEKCGKPRHWMRSIGIIDQFKDRLVAHVCPDCGGSYPR